MKKLIQLALVAAAAAAAFGATAQEYPSKDKTVTIVVPFAAGGPTDRVARDLAEALRKPLGANVVVDNTAGAGSSIGAARAARALPCKTRSNNRALLRHVPSFPSKFLITSYWNGSFASGDPWHNTCELPQRPRITPFQHTWIVRRAVRDAYDD